MSKLLNIFLLLGKLKSFLFIHVTDQKEISEMYNISKVELDEKCDFNFVSGDKIEEF